MGASRKFFDFRPSEIAFGAFWGETARVGRPTANLVIVFKRSHNLKAWLPGKNFQLGTARIRSVLALWSRDIQILCVVVPLASC